MIRKKTAQFGMMVAVMTMVLSLLFQMLIPLKAQAASDLGSVTLSVERFTLGQGFFVEPIEVPIKEGDTGYDLLMRAVPNAEKVLHFNKDNTYLEWIEGADMGFDHIEVPSYIFDLSGSQMTMDTMKEFGNDYSNQGLGEFSYSSWSGWMYSVNHEFPEYSLASYQPKNGDVVRWQFTLYGTGLDVKGKNFGETDLRVPISDKDKAMQLLATVKKDAGLLEDPSVQWAYDNLKTLVQDPIAPQEKVNQNLEILSAALEGKANLFPQKITLDVTERELYLDDAGFQLIAMVEPGDVMMNQVEWSSSDVQIAEVTQEGLVTPVKGGETTITAETRNGLKATCRVTVKERPITEFKIKPTELTLVQGSSATIQTVIRPENTTDSKILKWESGAPEIVTVDNGTVTAQSPGHAVITAQTVNGLTAECQITVIEDYEKLLEKLKESLQKLPEPGALTLEDENTVLAAQSSYERLPQEYKDQLTRDEKAKLEASVEVMQSLKADAEAVQKFSEKLNALLNINQITVSDNEQVKDLVDIDNTWHTLTTRQQEMVKAEDLEKVQECQNKVAELKQEVEKVNKQLKALKEMIDEPEQFNLGHIQTVVEARAAYNALCPYLQDVDQEPAGWIESESAKILIYAERLVRSIFVEEIKALDPQNEMSVKQFIHAMKIYEEMPADQRPLFNEEVTDQMMSGQSIIAAKAHKNEVLTVSGDSLPWYVRVNIKAIDVDHQLKEGVSTLYGEGSSIRKAYRVTFEDLESGLPYEPKNDLDFRLSYKPSEEEKDENFKIFRQEMTGSEDGLVGRMMSKQTVTDVETVSYDQTSGIWQFSTKAPCVFGVVYKFIPLTGITIESSITELEEGTGTILSVRPNPENATLGDEGLQVEWSSSDPSTLSVNEKGEVKGLKAGKSAVITATVKNQPHIKAEMTLKVKTGAAVESLRASLNPSLNQMLQETSNYIVNTELEAEIKEPGSIGYDSQWNVFGIARAREIAAATGMDTSQWDRFIKTFYNNAAGQYKKDGGIIKDGERKRTEYSKFIVTLTACGYDAREVSEEKYNVFDHLRDFKKVKAQGINGPIWALIALKCSDKYDGVLPITEAEAAQTGLAQPTSEERLVNTVLDAQLADGGWTLAGDIADSDMTGMALQSLWPYYMKAESDKTAFEKSVTERVNTAVERGLKCLKDIQMESGGYGSRAGGTLQETEESICQVVVALNGLGIDPADGSQGYLKPGNQWMMSALTRFYVSGGGFMHLLAGSGDDGGAKPGERDGMATEQGFYTLVAYGRFINQKNSLYNINDEKIQGGQAANGEVAGGKDKEQNGSGNQGSKKGNTGGQKASAGQKESGWNFDTTMAKSDRAGLNGIDEGLLKNISMLLGLCGLGIVGAFMIIRLIFGHYGKR